MELDKFCFCTSIKIGVIIIGSLYTVGFIFSVVTKDVLVALPDGICAFAFLSMINEDSKDSRLCLFAAYCIQVLIYFVISIVKTVKSFAEYTHTQVQLCNQLSESEFKDQLVTVHAGDQDINL